jgi:hypothetical protein
MKNALLKNIVLSGSVALMTVGAALADQTPTDAQAQIGAQLGITHDSITQLLSKMDQQSQTNDGMAHADYKIKAVQEHAKVQAALNEFESYLRDNLFPEVRSDLVTYNAIYTSDAYSDAEKKTLLANMEKQLDALFSNASDRYTAAVYKVLSAMGPDFKSFLAQFSSHATDSGYTQTILDRTYGDFSPKFYQDSVLPVLADECYSRSCISLSSADLIILFTVASDSFGKAIAFQTLDGKTFNLNPYTDVSNNSVTDGNMFQTNTVGTFLPMVSNYYVQTLSRTDLYTSYIQGLPFDISADQIGAAQLAQQQAAAAAQKALLDGLLSQREQAIDGIIKNLGGSDVMELDELKFNVTKICSIGQGTQFACQQGLGCPTSDDFQKMLAAVNQNNGLSKNYKKEIRPVLTDDAKTGGGFSCSK